MVMDPKFLYYDYIPTLADHVIDFPKKRYTDWGITPKHGYPQFDVNNVKDNDVIFVKTDLLPQFFHHLYGRIKRRFILLTGVAGMDICHGAVKFLEEGKIIRWIGCNLCFQHPKAVKIPIAFEEPERRRGGPSTGEGGDQQLLSELYDGRMVVGEKTCKLLVTHIGNTHASRGQVKALFAGKEFTHFVGKMDFESYMKTIDEYRFVLCPRGSGTDTHRFWEVLLMGSIPVVEKDGLWDLYDNFPCIIVDEFADVSQELLESYVLNEEKQKNVDKYLVIENFKSFIDGVVASACRCVSLSESIKFVNGDPWIMPFSVIDNQILGRPNYAMGQLKMDSVCGRKIFEIASDPRYEVFLDIGTFCGLGSTKCLLDAIIPRMDKSRLYALETNKQFHQITRNYWKKYFDVYGIDKSKFILYNGSLVSFDELDENYVTDAGKTKHNYDYNEDIRTSSLVKLPEKVDVACFDGGHFSSYLEWKLLRDELKVLIMDDVNSSKCRAILEDVMHDDTWKILYRDPGERPSSFLVAEKISVN